MNNYSVLIYLFFLKRNNGFNQKFLDEIFHFYRFLALNTTIRNKRLFSFKENEVYDVESENTLKTLHHHEMISEQYQITEIGIHFLEEQLKKDSIFKESISKFLTFYQLESAKENSCYVDTPNFIISCDLCKERICENLALNFQDFLNLIHYKGIKNPYRSHKL